MKKKHNRISRYLAALFIALFYGYAFTMFIQICEIDAIAAEPDAYVTQVKEDGSIDITRELVNGTKLLLASPGTDPKRNLENPPDPTMLMEDFSNNYVIPRKAPAFISIFFGAALAIFVFLAMVLYAKYPDALKKLLGKLLPGYSQFMDNINKKKPIQKTEK